MKWGDGARDCSVLSTEPWKGSHSPGLVGQAIKKAGPVIILEDYKRYFTFPKDNIFGSLEYLTYWFLKLPGWPEWPVWRLCDKHPTHSRSGFSVVCPTNYLFYWAFFQKRKKKLKKEEKGSFAKYLRKWSGPHPSFADASSEQHRKL